MRILIFFAWCLYSHKINTKKHESNLKSLIVCHEKKIENKLCVKFITHIYSNLDDFMWFVTHVNELYDSLKNDS